MRRFAILAVVALLHLTGCVSQPPLIVAPAVEPQPEVQAPPSPTDVLLWNQEQRYRNFQQMEKLFPSRRVSSSSDPRALPQGHSIEAVLGGGEAVEQAMDRMNIAGLLVLHGGRVKLEKYLRGLEPHERWISFSVAKSLTSTLVGAAIKDRAVRSLDDLVTRYVPELSGSAYEQVTVRHLLTMTSGVRWNEDYTDPNSDVVQLFARKSQSGESVLLSYLKRLPREAPPGTKWVYNTAESNLVGVLVSKATGKSLAQYLSEKLWHSYGMEADAYWQVDELGQEPGGCCLSIVLRDYGRVGQFMLDASSNEQSDILPTGWIAEATATHQRASETVGYGYQWWTNPDGSFAAIGIFGQMIYVDPSRELVIVTLSAWPKPTGKELSALRAGLVQTLTKAVESSRQSR